MSTSGKVAFSVNLWSGFPPDLEGEGWATFVVNEDFSVSASRSGALGNTTGDYNAVRATDNDQVLVMEEYVYDPEVENVVAVYKGVGSAGQLLWEELDERGKVADALGVARDSINLGSLAADYIAGRRYYLDIVENDGGSSGPPINVIVSCAVTASGFTDWRTIPFPENPVTTGASVYGLQVCNGVMFYYVLESGDPLVGQLYAKDMASGVVTNYGDVVFSVQPGFPFRTGPVVVADASGNARYVCFYGGAYGDRRPLEYYDLQAGGPVNMQPSGYYPDYYDTRYFVQSGGVLYGATPFDFLLEAVPNIYDPPASWSGTGRIADDVISGNIHGSSNWLQPTNITLSGGGAECFWTDVTNATQDC